ncbi:hypothetical protein D3C76_901750 [compost metagenome]|jgi:hypothetical protein|uniref:Uncharacterized protein n=1 Tax=Pseudomonas wadenswilerensis TaxID=1785161 RepID=A0A380T1W5_9PSED|nr:hypothetical protein [Pseudomonas]MCE5981710.1 hypothetical protein [Pseudomonas sp. LF19]UVM20085.1 hypothetical protein LOY45_16665 [Pseudomonas wadenswilerensis]SPO67052.1 protein of unknown function [Pseudomonas sp. JV241A]SUQ63935.1 hypothetical protein CCOS864_03389 [Pseudomonas wadenswilerensis]
MPQLEYFRVAFLNIYINDFSIYIGAPLMLLTVFDWMPKSVAATYMLVIFGLCFLSFPLAMLVRCPLCNAAMLHLYKDEPGTALSRRVGFSEVRGLKKVRCLKCDGLMKIRD